MRLIERLILEPLAGFLAMPLREMWRHDRWKREKRDPDFTSISLREYTILRGMVDASPEQRWRQRERMRTLEKELALLEVQFEAALERKESAKALLLAEQAESLARTLLHRAADALETDRARGYHSRMWSFRDQIGVLEGRARRW